jgi:tRNA dimethylallyltransferase
MGATATGKSALAVRFGRRFGGEVVSMDSRQVYRHMDIGTGKVTESERGGLTHHLLDILEPDEAGSAGRHAVLVKAAIREIDARGRVPILVGGTGLYFDAVFRPLIEVGMTRSQIEEIRREFDPLATGELYAELERVDADRAAQLSPNDRVRITRALEIFRASGTRMSEHLRAQAEAAETDRAEYLKLVLTMPRETLRRRIDRRTRRMYDAGWCDEVKALINLGYRPGCPGMQSLGYEEIASAISAGTDPRETVESVITRTQQYAKRQETFFRREADAVWLDVTAPDYPSRAEDLVRTFLGRPE